MDKILRPERFDSDPGSATASNEWRHWKITFDNFLAALGENAPNKLHALINFVSPRVYDYITNVDYEEAIHKLEELYIQPKNEIYARHMLSSREQKPDETIDKYIQVLRTMARDCNFLAVSADAHRDEALLGAFISGINSTTIRQRLLENKTLSLDQALVQARCLEIAQRNSESFSTTPYTSAAANGTSSTDDVEKMPSTIQIEDPISAAVSQKCYFCGRLKHSRSSCPAKSATCHTCGKVGHFSNVCKSKSKFKTSATVMTLATTNMKNRALIKIKVNETYCSGLIDSGSHESYISEATASTLKLTTIATKPQPISMAASSLTMITTHKVYVNLSINDSMYRDVKLSVLKNLCHDIILGQDFLSLHKTVSINYGGRLENLSICSLMSQLTASTLFNLQKDTTPIATPSRRFSKVDEDFIKSETHNLLEAGIIETSRSPWRAQVLVTTNERHKRRMVVDYSQTVNRYTCLDAYPLPRIDSLVEKVSKYQVFSTVDLKSAYHQISLQESDKPYTAFEANGSLYQFTRLPFGVTNGVAVFQRIIDEVIKDNNIADTFAYLDNVLICGHSSEEHDANLNHLLDVFTSKGITLNPDKSVIAVKSIQFLGYTISHQEIRPDPERLQPLRDLPLPDNNAKLKRAIGLFSYYSCWINRFSDKIRPLIDHKNFPLTTEAQSAFDSLKKEVENSCLRTIDPNLPLIVETDASDFAIAATLNQGGRPLAFFSRSLSQSEKRYAAVEKEAHSIVEALKKWKHYLVGRHFTLITDQKSVSFMFDSKHHGKIKNDKITRWRIELAPYNYDIVYRPGNDNKPADALSRVCSILPHDANERLKQLHEDLSHPGVKKLFHFVKTKNLNYSIEQVRKVNDNCQVCSEFKPRFAKPTKVHLIKALNPFDRISIDFKGPLPISTHKHSYLLTIVDEYSRFCFAYPCYDMSAKTVIRCLSDLFSTFGLPAYVHSDRGAQFMSNQVKTFLHSKGVATSRTCPYNPTANGQCEKFNHNIWRGVQMQLRTKQLSDHMWEEVLPDVLHSLRSLLCTTTNETPHERLFRFQRRSSSGCTIPTFLSQPGKVYLKNFTRNSKREPLVQEVELLESNPHYAFIRFPDGKESTVSVKNLAPNPNQENIETTNDVVQVAETPQPIPSNENDLEATLPNEDGLLPETTEHDSDELRRSTRTSKHPSRYGLNVYDK
jgi:hypothetical protein